MTLMPKSRGNLTIHVTVQASPNCYLFTTVLPDCRCCPQSFYIHTQNQPAKLKFSFKEQREYDTIDEDIASLEEKIEALESDMAANATNSAKLSELLAQKEQVERELEEKMERWVYLNDLAEKIEAQNVTIHGLGGRK